MRISDWSSDVCSSDLTQSAWFHRGRIERRIANAKFHIIEPHDDMGLLKPETKLAASQWFFDMLRDLGRAQAQAREIGRATWRGRVCQYGEIPVVAVSFKNKDQR